MDFAFYTDAEKKLKELRSKEEKIEVKEGTKIIGSFAFRAPNVKEVVLPDSVEVIQMHAFGNCENLQKVVFGKGIKRIFPDIFSGCHNLSEIEFAGDKDPDFAFENGDVSGRVALLFDLTQFIIIMARKTAANLNIHRLDLRIWLSVGCKRRFYFFLYLPVFSYFRLWYSVLCDSTYSLIFSIVTPPVVAMK